MADLALRLNRLLSTNHGESDTDLLDRFLRDRDGLAFATIIERHGAMVLAVCRRVLRHRQDAEDAFQATFLVLARRAGAVKPRSMLGNWLYGVAYRTALSARRAPVEPSQKEAVPNRPLSPLAKEEIASVVVYQVSDLAADEKEGEALAKVLRATVAPKSWSGDCGVEFLPGRRVLVVRQTRIGHEETLKLIEILRQTTKPGGKDR
jgi:RNA polymerase sigma factor (sigma-70 family)